MARHLAKCLQTVSRQVAYLDAAAASANSWDFCALSSDSYGESPGDGCQPPGVLDAQHAARWKAIRANRTVPSTPCPPTVRIPTPEPLQAETQVEGQLWHAPCGVGPEEPRRQTGHPTESPGRTLGRQIALAAPRSGHQINSSGNPLRLASPPAKHLDASVGQLHRGASGSICQRMSRQRLLVQP